MSELVILEKLKNLALILFTFCLLQSNIYGQKIFNHIENSAGFGNLKENNGVAVADYDGDFDLDVFVVTIWKDETGKEETQSKLFRNNGDGTFTDVTEGSGLENLLPLNEVDATYETFIGLRGFKNGAFWGDYDNDGDPDIFFTHLSRVQLFNNQGDGTFVEVTQTAGIVEENDCENMGAVWFDYNNDSYLDIYIVDWNACDTNTLYKNNGDGTFTDVTQTTNIKTSVGLPGYTPFPFDFNKDGFMDLYVTNDVKKPNQLFINNQGNSFTEDAQNYNIDVSFNDMGIAIGDYNKDGLFDFYTTAISNNTLLTGKQFGSFENKASDFGVNFTNWSWGTTFSDFDLDGDEDLIVVNGFEIASQQEIRNFYFENTFSNGTPSFSNANNQGIGELSVSVEALPFDFDNDGDLDIFITNSESNSYFYENSTINSSSSSTLNWFQLSLQGTTSNRDAIGTKITLTTDKDSYIRYYSGVGFLGQSLKPVHFGLADSTNITELKIEWPSGHIDAYNNIELNTFGKAIEATSYEKLNIQPAVKTFGCTDLNSCNYNPNATANDGSCIYAQVSNTISGSDDVGYLSTESYSYNLVDGHTIEWTVEGGKLMSGQGTANIEVHWEIESQGKIVAVVTTDECKSDEIVLNVNLGIQNVDDDKSLARIWNEALLQAIRGDFARPTIHARNLFHTSIAMYDAWAIYSDEAAPYLIGNTVENFSTDLVDFTPLEDIITSRKKAISYAVYRLLTHRFNNSPSKSSTLARFDAIMNSLGYDTTDNDLDYAQGNAVALGNYIGQKIIEFGLQDGSRESSNHDNEHYVPVNEPLAPIVSGNPTISNPNRWQSLSLETNIDQSGNLIEGNVLNFLSPEWGNVLPFAMDNSNRTSYSRNGNSYNVYYDPLDPPYIDDSDMDLSDAYKKGFAQVSIWSAHLDPTDGVTWDISPKSIGNISSTSFPNNFSDYDSFYKFVNGGDIGQGHTVNPITNQPYEEQLVPRGDYTRVLAEFWADGPDSETPPGHWFTILNYVNDHPELSKKMKGEGSVLDHLEWDVKAYFLLGGAMHDAAIAAWSVKGWYDYIRPISAIRYMADLGQSSDPNQPNYHANGIPLVDGYIELVKEGDPLNFGFGNPNLNKIKVKAWKGHDEIDNTATDQAGVDWILAEDWWPYQRPSFVTPPFAGYVSGHSTYSRAAAEVLTLLTGDAFFPGGMAEFVAKKNEFLVFEEGPSVDITLQWATYRDASDQCSLSRIWGGIHPPADDIPGRLIGEQVGVKAFNFGYDYFNKKSLSIFKFTNSKTNVFPNPVDEKGILYVSNSKENQSFSLIDLGGRTIQIKQEYQSGLLRTKITLQNLSTGIYILKDDKGNQWKILIE